MDLTKNKAKQVAIENIIKKHQENLLRIQGIVDLGVGYRIEDHHLTNELAIIIEVVNQREVAALIPTSIEGIAVNLIESPVPETLFHSSEKIHPEIRKIADFRNQHFKKLIGGIRIRNGYGKGLGSGTLGAIAYDRESNEAFGITCRHVLVSDKRWRSKPNYPVIHPDKKWTPSTDVGTVLNEGKSTMDCIRFALNPNREIDHNHSFLGINGKIRGIATDIVCGTKVMKSGSQTGVTYGVIVSQSVTNKNRFIVFPDDDFELIDGELTMGGDSGSVWLLNDGSMKVIGLHCLGNKSKQYDAELGVALRMDAVADYLNLKF